MDENKRAMLLTVGYRIRGTCGLCKHSEFSSPGQKWGVCKITTYQHQKHTGAPREMSIYVGGTCSRFELYDEERLELGGFREFVG